MVKGKCIYRLHKSMTSAETPKRKMSQMNLGWTTEQQKMKNICKM